MDNTGDRPASRRIVRAVPVVAVGLLFAPLPAGLLGPWQGQFLDFGHVPLFAGITLALRAGWGMSLRVALLVALGLAGLAEVAQPLVGRTGDRMDFVRGCVGALAAATGVRAWQSRRFPARCTGYAALTLVLLVGPVVEVAPYVADTVEGHRAFPVLADFPTDRALLRWEFDQVAHAHTGEGVRLEFLPGPGEYASAALRPIRSDFGGYRWLCAEFRVLDGPLDLALSVRTGAGAGGTTHVDVGQKYASGAHVVRLDLVVLAERGRPSRLDLSAIRSVIFFVLQPRESRAIVLTRVWLEP